MSDKDIKSPFNACQHREYCRGLSAELTTLGRQEGHDAAMAVHYRKKYEQASAALAAKDSEIARLLEALECAHGWIGYAASTVEERNFIDEVLAQVNAALSQSSAQNAI